MPGGRVWGRGGAWGRERRLPLGPQLGAAGGSGLWGRRQAHLPPPRSGRAEKAPFTRALLVRTKAAFKPLPRSHTCQPPGSPHTCAGPRLRARTPGRGPSGQDGAARRPPCADPLPQQVLPASSHPPKGRSPRDKHRRSGFLSVNLPGDGHAWLRDRATSSGGTAPSSAVSHTRPNGSCRNQAAGGAPGRGRGAGPGAPRALGHRPRGWRDRCGRGRGRSPLCRRRPPLEPCEPSPTQDARTGLHTERPPGPAFLHVFCWQLPCVHTQTLITA